MRTQRDILLYTVIRGLSCALVFVCLFANSSFAAARTVTCKITMGSDIAKEAAKYFAGGRAVDFQRSIAKYKKASLNGFRMMTIGEASLETAVCTNITLTLLKVSQLAIPRFVGKIAELKRPRRILDALNVIPFILKDISKIRESLKVVKASAELVDNIDMIEKSIIKQLQHVRSSNADNLIKPLSSTLSGGKVVYRVVAKDDQGFRMIEFAVARGYLVKGERRFDFVAGMNETLGRANLFAPTSIAKQAALFARYEGVRLVPSIAVGGTFKFEFEHIIEPIEFEIDPKIKSEKTIQALREFFRLFTTLVKHVPVRRVFADTQPVSRMPADNTSRIPTEDQDSNALTDEPQKYVCYKFPKDKDGNVYYDKKPIASSRRHTFSKKEPLKVLNIEKLKKPARLNTTIHAESGVVLSWAHVLFAIPGGQDADGWVIWEKLGKNGSYKRFDAAACN